MLRLRTSGVAAARALLFRQRFVKPYVSPENSSNSLCLAPKNALNPFFPPKSRQNPVFLQKSSCWPILSNFSHKLRIKMAFPLKI